MSVTQEITKAVGAPAYDPRAALSPSDAEMDAALVFTADGYSDADGVDHVTAADKAVAAAHAAEKALVEKPAPKALGHDPDREIAALVNAIPEARNPALRKAINRTADAKIAEVRLARIDTEASSPESHDAWQQARRVLDEAANDLAFAPITGAHDATIRAQGFIDAVGRDRKTDQPIDDAGDLNTLVVSMVDALAWLGHREPDPDAWDLLVSDAKAAIRKVKAIDLSLDRLGQVEASPRNFVEPGIREDTEDQRAQAAQRRDDLIASVLNATPPHIGGALFQLEVLVGRCLDDPLDLSTYAARSAAVERCPEGSLIRGLALIAGHLASLRDRSIPEDWMAELEAHDDLPGFDQAARHAIDAGLAADDIQMIHQGEGYPRSQLLPILQFAGPGDGFLHARPDGVWKWEPVK